MVFTLICEKIKKHFKTVAAIVFATLLILALVLELSLFVFRRDIQSDGKTTVITDLPDFVTVDCTFNGTNYNVTGQDPQIVYTGFAQKTKYVVLTLKNPLTTKLDIQIYYGTQSFGFSEENTVKATLPALQKQIVLEMNEAELLSFRLDLSRSADIESVELFDSETTFKLRAVNSFSILRVLIMFLGFSLLIVLGYVWYKRKDNEGSLKLCELVFLISVFVYYFLWSITQYINYAPDEMMRLDINFFLFENNRLPVGDELLNPIWGFSYAHIPTMLCNILGYFFMLLVSPFTQDALYLVFASRMVSVLAGVGTVYFVIKAANLLFDSSAKWLMIVLTAFIPQFAFLSSYVNNDILAVFGTSIIFYVWIYVLKNRWNYRIATLLVMGLSVCALSYYYSYAWILISVVFCIVTYFKQNPRDYRGFFKLGGYVVAFTLVLVSYLFVRHLVLYGDLLGMSTGQIYGELHAAPGMKPSERFSLSEQGVSLGDMLFKDPYNWIASTVTSFFAVFGYMAYPAPTSVIDFYKIIFFLGIIAFVAFFARKLIKKKKLAFNTVLLYTSLAVISFITILLRIYNSYTDDFQAQGKYCYPALIPIVLVVSRGIDYLIKLLPKEKHRYFVLGSIITSFIIVSLLVFKIVFVESCIV